MALAFPAAVRAALDFSRHAVKSASSRA